MEILLNLLILFLFGNYIHDKVEGRKVKPLINGKKLPVPSFLLFVPSNMHVALL